MKTGVIVNLGVTCQPTFNLALLVIITTNEPSANPVMK